MASVSVDVFNRRVDILVVLGRNPNATAIDLCGHLNLDRDTRNNQRILQDLYALEKDGHVQRSKDRPYRWTATDWAMR